MDAWSQCNVVDYGQQQCGQRAESFRRQRRRRRRRRRPCGCGESAVLSALEQPPLQPADRLRATAADGSVHGRDAGRQRHLDQMPQDGAGRLLFLLPVAVPGERVSAPHRGLQGHPVRGNPRHLGVHVPRRSQRGPGTIAVAAQSGRSAARQGTLRRRLGHRSVGFARIDPFCQCVRRRQQQQQHSFYLKPHRKRSVVSPRPSFVYLRSQFRSSQRARGFFVALLVVGTSGADSGRSVRRALGSTGRPRKVGRRPRVRRLRPVRPCLQRRTSS